MFSNRGYVPKNGKQPYVHSQRAVSRGFKRGGIFNGPTNLNRMEPKLIWLALNIVGIPAYVAAIILNVGSWKADVLFFIMVLFGIAKFIRYVVKTWQEFRRGEIEIEMEKRKIKK
jgi:ABC-type branched-subunit amino acid transport system permease subunit